MSETKRIAVGGSNHYAWKGDGVQYRQAHAWVRAKLLETTPLVCTKCGSTNRVELANTNGHVCTRNVKDYTFLCKKCHNDADGTLINLKQGVDAIVNSPRRNPNITTKTCSTCKIEKLLSEFYMDKDRYRYECKICNTKRTRAIGLAITGAPRIKLYEEISRGVRTCTKCKITKLLSEFPQDLKRKSGTASWCRLCTKNGKW